MKKEIFLIIIFVIIFFSVIANSEDFKKVSEKVLQELDENERVNVVIKFQENLNLSEEIENLNLENADSGEIISVEVDDAELDEIVENENVEYIYYDYPIHAFLQESVSLINASATWVKKINGINLTGIGETICVIDSGINYSHKDLGGCFGNGCKVIGGWDFVNDDGNPMDDHGHGTHIAGIIAANGSITGVAPGAKIIAIKVLNSAGSGTTSNMVKAINWCVGNSSIYNISVISMSLGTSTLFSDYCDDIAEFSDLKNAINSAIAKNISVVVATGNSKNYTDIASPACIENSTAVGMSYDKNYISLSWYSGETLICSDEMNSADKLVCWGNRNSITDLVAPGAIINSTWLDGKYYETQGTSMATPMVSASFALLNEFYKLQSNRNLTPYEIQNNFNSTGKIIYDASSGLNFSRVDIFSAILNLDGLSPNIALISPENSFSNISQNLIFSCNATDLQLKNLTLKLWNSSGIYYENTTGITGIFNQSIWNLVDIPYENYDWNCFSCDAEDNCGYAENNFSFSLFSLVVNLTSPTNNSYGNTQIKNFICNVTSQIGLSNATFHFWNSSTMIYNKTENISGTINGSIFSLNFTLLNFSEGRYFWNCFVENNLSYSKFAAANFSFVYDLTSPNLSVVIPINNSWLNELKINVSLDENGFCWYEFDGENKSMDSFNLTYYYFENSSVAEMNSSNVTIYCNDSAGNFDSDLIYFSIDKTNPEINLISPADSYSTSSTSLDFQFNVSDNLNISSCYLIISGDSSSATTNSSAISNETNIISKSFSSGSYTWKINCTDTAGNIGNSSTRSLTITSSSTTTNSPGGGGGSSATATIKVFSVNEDQLNEGYNLYVEEGNNINFEIENESHKINISEISDNYLKIKIFSKIQEASLTTGEEKKFEMTGDNFYDLSVKLNLIYGSSANLTIKKIFEKIISEVKNESAKNETGVVISDEENNKEYILVIVGILIIGVGVYFYFKKNDKEKRKKFEAKSKRK